MNYLNIFQINLDIFDIVMPKKFVESGSHGKAIVETKEPVPNCSYYGDPWGYDFYLQEADKQPLSSKKRFKL